MNKSKIQIRFSKSFQHFFRENEAKVVGVNEELSTSVGTVDDLVNFNVSSSSVIISLSVFRWEVIPKS